jgi:hypothetical protein
MLGLNIDIICSDGFAIDYDANPIWTVKWKKKILIHQANKSCNTLYGYIFYCNVI